MRFFKKLLCAQVAISITAPVSVYGFSNQLEKESRLSPQIEHTNFLIAQSDDEPESAGTLKITVTGTKTPRPVKDYPGTVTVITQEELNSNDSQSLRQLFQNIPGINVKNTFRNSLKGPAGQEDVNIRGMNGDRVLMLVDGIRLPTYRYSSYYDFGRGDYIDFNTLNSVEILSGPASSLYGSDALGGVVSFRSLEPDDLLDEDQDFAFEIPASYNGANNGFNEAIKIAGNFSDKMSGVLVFSREDSEEFKVKADDKYINDVIKKGNSIFSNLIYEPNEFSKINLILENVKRSVDETVKDANLATNYTFLDSDTNTDRARYSIGYEYENPNAISFINYYKAKLFAQNIEVEDNFDNQRTSYGRPVNERRDQSLKHDSYGFDMQLRSDFDISGNNHKLTYGIEYSESDAVRLREVTNNVTGSISQLKETPDTTVERLGAYLQDEIDLGRLNLIAGLRFDNYDLDPTSDDAYINNGVGVLDPVGLEESALSPKLAAIYELNPSLSIYGQYSKGFKAPAYSDLNSSFTNTVRRYKTLANPDLKPETSNNYEIGFKGSYSKFDFTISGFYSKYDDFIEQFTNLGVINGYTNYKSTNASQAEVYGTELTTEYRFNPDSSGFSLLASLAYSEGNNETDDKPLETIEPLKAIFTLRYKTIDDKWKFDLRNTHVGGPRVADSTSTFIPSSYNKIDLIADYQATNSLDLNLGIYNLMDERYYVYSDVRGKSSSDSTLTGFSQPERHLKAGFKFRF